MQRREFLHAATAASAVAATSALAAAPASEPADAAPFRFKIGMYLGELDLPFDESLAKAKELGAEFVWFHELKSETPIGRMTDAEADRMAERVRRHGLEILLFNAGTPFKQIHLADLPADNPNSHPEFRTQLAELTRSMEIARRIGVGAVGCFTFAWPGEYSAGKPTWPMRWATRGGLIAEVDVQKWTNAFKLVAERAERLEVNVALAQMPWNYTNTTTNFRQLVEPLGSRRLKVMWGPADNLNSGELDVATSGFRNVRPYLYGLHLKDLHVIDGPRLQFEYRPLGRGDVDYLTILRTLRTHRCEVGLSVSTHFLPPDGTKEDAMRMNFENLRELILKSAT